MTADKKRQKWTTILIISAVFAVISIVVLLSGIISRKVSQPDPTEPPIPTEPPVYAIMDDFDAKVSDDISAAYDAAYNVKKTFWIEETADVAPKPNESCYGESTDISSLQWLLDDAAELLDGQETVFSTDIEILPGSTVTYYLDDSIFAVTWQQVIDNYAYTFSEVKISHPSQFRRYLAGNEYDSDYSHPVSRMGNYANAVMASSADFYRGRNHGIIVYQGQVMRTNYSDLVDTCFIDKNGDLIFVPAGELIGMEAAQAFVDEHNIDFSLAFGPILVEDGVRCEPDMYYLGEINDKYPRVALCQKDTLHYIVVAANAKQGYFKSITIHTFAENIAKLNCEKAYALDGGKTGTIAMHGKALNPLQENHEKWISDIIYFATAIPSTDSEATEPTQP